MVLRDMHTINTNMNWISDSSRPLVACGFLSPSRAIMVIAKSVCKIRPHTKKSAYVRTQMAFSICRRTSWRIVQMDHGQEKYFKSCVSLHVQTRTISIGSVIVEYKTEIIILQKDSTTKPSSSSHRGSLAVLLYHHKIEILMMIR